MISQLEVIQIKIITHQNPPCLCQSIQHGNSLITCMWAWLHSIHNVFLKLWLLIFSFTHQKNPDSLNIIYTLWKVFRCPRYHATLPSEFQKPYTPCMSAHFSFVNVKCISNNSSIEQNITTLTKAYKWKQNWKLPLYQLIILSLTLSWLQVHYPNNNTT